MPLTTFVYGDDLINGGPGADQVYGETGDDAVNGSDGVDFVSAGDGDDRDSGRFRSDPTPGRCQWPACDVARTPATTSAAWSASSTALIGSARWVRASSSVAGSSTPAANGAIAGWRCTGVR